MADGDWRSYAKRQRIVNQIDEYLRITPEKHTKSAQELESSVSIHLAA